MGKLEWQKHCDRDFCWQLGDFGAGDPFVFTLEYRPLGIYRGKCVASGANADDAQWALDALRQNVQGCWNFITEMGF